MNENKKTLTFATIAIVLVVLAFIMSLRKITPEAFLDQGEKFFPEFTDPNSARSLEVITYNEATGSAYPFKVTFTDGRWVIPSHHNYPADAEKRLAETAAGIIQLTKDDFRSDNVADHELCGVIDPIDETLPGLSGRGKRVTIRGQNENILADIIIGKEVPRREGYHFVRLPDQKRIYAAKVDVDISSKFSDWIETDLMKINKNDIVKFISNDYSINERTRQIDLRDKLILTLEDSIWSANKMKSGEKVDKTEIQNLLGTLDELSIVGVRPKSSRLMEILNSSEKPQITMSDQMNLQSKGFFFGRDGQLYSNDGEVVVSTQNGLQYELRFGEIVHGSGLAVSAGETTDSEQEGPAENRYLFITVGFNGDLLVNSDKKAEFQEKAKNLNERFSRWFYVISAESFEKLRVKREDIIVKEEA